MKTKIFNLVRFILFKNKFCEVILYHLTNEKSLESWWARLPANYYQYSKGAIRNVERNGLTYCLDISDYMEWVIFFGIKTEPREALYGLISNSKVIFDVGANIGETTLNIAKLCNIDCFLHSFEPDKYCFEKLKNNVGLNSFKNIKLNPFGLGEKEADYLLITPTKDNRGGNRIVLNSHEKPNIHIKRLDDYINQNNINKVDLIKIDVEGFELKVLKGGENCIEMHRPRLFIEVNDSNLKQQGNSAEELIKFLELYYSNLKHAETGESINSNINLINKHFDLIAIN